MAEFTFNGTTMKLKVKAVKPSLISTLFKLEEGSIVICDVDEGDVHLPNENKFDPPLIDGHKYTVGLKYYTFFIFKLLSLLTSKRIFHPLIIFSFNFFYIIL